MSGFSGSQAAQGGMGGAMTGFGVGNMIAPGIGGLIGGGIGLLGGSLLGGFGGDPQAEFRELMQKLAAGYQNRQAPQAGNVMQAGNSALANNRTALIAQLEAQARGQGPSAAREQMRAGMDLAGRNMTAAASGAGGRGVNQGAAMRAAMGQGSAMQARTNQDTSVMRAQEQLNAVGQLGQNIAQGINSDNALATWNAGQVNQRDQFNAEMAMQTLGLNDRSQLQALMMAQGAQQPGIGTSLMAGGAAMLPAAMQMRQQQLQQQRQGIGAMGGIGPQGPGAPGWDTSPMGMRQMQMQQQEQMRMQQEFTQWLQQQQRAGTGIVNPNW